MEIEKPFRLANEERARRERVDDDEIKNGASHLHF